MSWVVLFDRIFCFSFSKNSFVIKLRLFRRQLDAFVLAILAFAKSRAPDACIEALAIIFYAGGLRAGAASRMKESLPSLKAFVLISERKRVFFDGQFQSQGSGLGLLGRIMTVQALAEDSTDPLFGEALAVEPKAAARLAATGRVSGLRPHPLQAGR